MAHLSQSRPQQARLGVTSSLTSYAPGAALARLQRIFAVWRQRQHLARLPDHMRRDIGLSDVDVVRETQRPLWDAPMTWRK